MSLNPFTTASFPISIAINAFVLTSLEVKEPTACKKSQIVKY